MTQPVSPQNAPYAVDVEEGKDYYWCTCGRSQKQPFCDGAHEGTEFRSMVFTAAKTEAISLCGC